MNLWLLTSEYPPEYGGGIATYVHHTARMLSERGHFVTVFAAAESLPSGWQVEEASERLRVVRFASGQTPQSQVLGSFARWGYDAAYVLAEFIRRDGAPDVLEAQEYLAMPYFVLQRRWLLDEALKDVPVLVTAHTPLFVCHRYDQAPAYRFPGYWIGEMERFSLIAADGVAFPSAFLRREIESELPQICERSRVIANPYRAVDIYTVPPANGLRKGFLFNAKIERRKGIELLLAAFRQLWDSGMNEPLILLGDDWDDELHQRRMGETISQRFADYIARGLLDWRGKQPPLVVQQVLAEVRAVILPSLFENYPYAVLEAMAAGVPALVSRSGGHAEIVEDGVSGWIFSHDQPGDLEEKIRSVVTLSGPEWERYSNAARERVKRVSDYAAVAPQKEAMLEWVRNQRQPRRWFPFLRGAQRAYQPPAEASHMGVEGLLSVVIPFYNLGEYLEDTLVSLQDVRGISVEIIVVDDGSDDPHSLRILNELQERYTFRLERTANQGLPAARNTGAQRAQGEFLAFLDADDCMDGRFYARALATLRQYDNVSYVGCWDEYFGEAQGYWPTWNSEPPYALVHNPMNCALVYRRSDYLLYGLNDSEFSHVMEDYDELLRLLENGCRGVAIPEPYLKYRVRNASKLHKANVNIKIAAYQLLAQKHTALYSEFGSEVANLLNANGPGYLYDNPTQWYPAVGWIVDQPAATVTLPGEEFPSNSVRTHLYFALRAMLLKPYMALSHRLPWLERIRLGVKRRMLG